MQTTTKNLTRAFKITVPHGMQTRLCKLFKVGQPLVHKALFQEINSEKAQAIRAEALKLGGYWEHK